IGPIPADRWAAEQWYDPNPDAPGKMITRWGGFLEQVDHFDARFFGISPREVVWMDPQQRLFLEVAWEALENAGQPLEHLSGTRAGVFIGVSGNEYSYARLAESARIDAYAAANLAPSIMANRLSYFLDVHGPSMAVDTACSTSLTALHLA